MTNNPPKKTSNRMRLVGLLCLVSGVLTFLVHQKDECETDHHFLKDLLLGSVLTQVAGLLIPCVRFSARVKHSSYENLFASLFVAVSAAILVLFGVLIGVVETYEHHEVCKTYTEDDAHMLLGAALVYALAVVLAHMKPKQVKEQSSDPEEGRALTRRHSVGSRFSIE